MMSEKKWAVIVTAEYDEWTDVCESKDAAVDGAKKEWKSMTPFDKKRMSVVAGLVNVDEDGKYDGGDIYDIAWDSKIVEEE